MLVVSKKFDSFISNVDAVIDDVGVRFWSKLVRSVIFLWFFRSLVVLLKIASFHCFRICQYVGNTLNVWVRLYLLLIMFYPNHLFLLALIKTRSSFFRYIISRSFRVSLRICMLYPFLTTSSFGVTSAIPPVPLPGLILFP